ncbi:c-type cytochrome [Chitinophaga caeni]|uniref:Photosynthetic reaction center cytochrome c subunit n=1 Tax=Chitinophaga caeni TaxID=2029983 RepID=A0A291QSY8_9BACT|nr:c-type cytochrome [Chitinophaga caeni]ATL46983.1 c-type cytochrome [Chitinophaga caeni]
MKAKITVTLLLAAIATVTLCSLAIPLQEHNEKPKNLKVLPKKIDPKELISIMRGFNASLGVKCNFCHAKSADDPKKMDFASDANKHKGIARGMMKMTTKINKKFFGGAEAREVTCYTCHKGHKEPEKMTEEKES